MTHADAAPARVLRTARTRLCADGPLRDGAQEQACVSHACRGPPTAKQLTRLERKLPSSKAAGSTPGGPGRRREPGTPVFDAALPSSSARCAALRACTPAPGRAGGKARARPRAREVEARRAPSSGSLAHPTFRECWPALRAPGATLGRGGSAQQQHARGPRRRRALPAASCVYAWGRLAVPHAQPPPAPRRMCLAAARC
jgi:hypothetical protein